MNKRESKDNSWDPCHPGTIFDTAETRPAGSSFMVVAVVVIGLTVGTALSVKLAIFAPPEGMPRSPHTAVSVDFSAVNCVSVMLNWFLLWVAKLQMQNIKKGSQSTSWIVQAVDEGTRQFVVMEAKCVQVALRMQRWSLGLCSRLIHSTLFCWICIDKSNRVLLPIGVRQFNSGLEVHAVDVRTWVSARGQLFGVSHFFKISGSKFNIRYPS